MSNQVEASSSVKLGVTIGASNVVTVVAATLNATLPFAKNVITLLEVPPGLDPTKITPIAISGGKLNKNTSDTAMIGITKYCESANTITLIGCLKISLKSSIDKVSPIVNIMTPSKIVMYGAIQINKFG